MRVCVLCVCMRRELAQAPAACCSEQPTSLSLVVAKFRWLSRFFFSNHWLGTGLTSGRKGTSRAYKAIASACEFLGALLHAPTYRPLLGDYENMVNYKKNHICGTKVTKVSFDRQFQKRERQKAL